MTNVKNIFLEKGNLYSDTSQSKEQDSQNRKQRNKTPLWGTHGSVTSFQSVSV